MTGGEETRIAMPEEDMVPVDVSPDGSNFLVVEGTGFPATGPLWTVPVMGWQQCSQAGNDAVHRFQRIHLAGAEESAGGDRGDIAERHKRGCRRAFHLGCPGKWRDAPTAHYQLEEYPE